MAGINKVILVGNLGKDPELKYVEGNIAKLSFSLATTEIYKDNAGNQIEHTEWHYIVFWRFMAENASKLLKKGMQIYVEGKLQTRHWVDKQGQKKNLTEIIGENFVVMQRKDSPDTQVNKGFDSKLDNSSDTKGLPY